MPKTKEQIEEEMEIGKKEEDIYTEAGREVAEDSDEITDVEEGFMEGYEEAEESKCKNCGNNLGEDFIEVEEGGETLKFCSEKCASEHDN